MYTLENHVGRLLELWRGPVMTSEEYHKILADIAARAQTIQQRFVLIVDSRQLVSIPPSLAVQYRSTHAMEPLTERAVILLPESQHGVRVYLEEMYARSTSIRFLQSMAETKAWLGELLTTEERARLDEFLAIKR
jgi:hypothetical protein